MGALPSTTLSRGALFVQRLALLALPIAGCVNNSHKSDATAEASAHDAISDAATDAWQPSYDALPSYDASPSYDALHPDATADPVPFRARIQDGGFAVPNGDGGTTWCLQPPAFSFRVDFYSWNPVACSGTTCVPRNTGSDVHSILGTIAMRTDAGDCVPVCDPATGTAACVAEAERQANGLTRLSAPGCTVPGMTYGCQAVELQCDGETRFVLGCFSASGPEAPPELPF